MRSSAWTSSRVHVDVRRLGRLVRPRAAAAGRPVRLRLPRARRSSSALGASRVRRQHAARLHLDAEVHRGELGSAAARAPRPQPRTSIASAFDFTRGRAAAPGAARAGAPRRAAASRSDDADLLAVRRRRAVLPLHDRALAGLVVRRARTDEDDARRRSRCCWRRAGRRRGRAGTRVLPPVAGLSVEVTSGVTTSDRCAGS